MNYKHKYGTCNKCKLKIDNYDYMICGDCCVFICNKCIIGNIANHKLCIKCKQYVTCNGDKCYDCNVIHYHMINDMIAVGDCDSDYDDFDIIVNLFMETNECELGEIKETTENNKIIINIGLLDHPGLENTMLDILNHMIPKLITYNNKKILFHCFAGVSRSATFGIAYLIATQKLSVIDAYNMVKTKRNIIQPNDGFMLALTKFAKV
jgi:hypothetical protein